MSNYMSIGAVAIFVDDLANISNENKIRILDAMFNGCGIETDDGGQIIQYTGLMYGDLERRTVISCDAAIDNFNPNADPYEVETEEEHPSRNYTQDDNLPPTIRLPQWSMKSKSKCS